MTTAVVLTIPFPVTGNSDNAGVEWRVAGLKEVNELLARAHYLGPIGGGRIIFGGYIDGQLVAAQVWRSPTSRHLPQDGTWLELSRWCLTPEAGAYGGSRMHRRAVRHIRLAFPAVRTLVSYSDPAHGHTGALYRSCNWIWAPTWLRLRPPPTANGDWGGKAMQSVKDRWVFSIQADSEFDRITDVDDPGALRRYLASDEWKTTTYRWPSILGRYLPESEEVVA
jgi:hypothetical protein